MRSLSAFNRGLADSALDYADRQITVAPTYFDAYQAKLQALTMTGRCTEAAHLRDSLLIDLKSYGRAMASYDTVTSAGMRSAYLRETGALRAFFGGRPLKEAYRRCVEIGRRRTLARYNQLRQIASLRCGG